jgi:RNA methyltransferase, TrmH family
MSAKGREIKFYGIHACLELWKRRPQDIIRVYLTKANLSTFSLLLKWCAKEKKPYHIVEEEELYKVTDSTHHEGISILAYDRFPLPIKKINFNEKCLLFLDGVSNPHNIGSIIRSCCHFGITHILGEKNKLPYLSPSAYRIAKGGAEHVSISYLENINELSLFKEKGFTFIATDCRNKKALSLYDYTFPSKSLIIFGSEDKGISKNLLKRAELILQIPGTDVIESLNVSVATALFLGEFWRQNH